MERTMKEDYIGVFLQWLFFVSLLSVILLPAFRFRRIALAHGRKGWLFFLIGLVAGTMILEFGKLVMQLAFRFGVAKTESPIFGFVLLAICFVAIVFAAELLERLLKRRGKM